ncbi:MAG: glycosyltransferase family 1 protein [Caldilineae bacterium]|nr:MAG: glycosyltransferase family 1 protein [Caldilineae bacterium]
MACMRPSPCLASVACPPMRILIDARTIQDHFPGIGRYVFNLAHALAPQLEGELLLLVDPRARNSHHPLADLQRHPNITFIPASIPIFHWRSQTHLPSLIRALHPDLVHCPYNVRPLRLPCPSLLTLYDVIPRLFPAYFPRRTRWQIEIIQRLALRASTGFVAISRVTARDYGRFYGVAGDAITVTPLAADPIFCPQPDETVHALRLRLGLPRRYHLYLGSNKPHKNLPRLIRAWTGTSALHHAADPPHLVIAGFWDERYPEARELAARLPARDRIHFLGSVPNLHLPALYAGAELFLFPSLYEGFGLPVLEAMACGTPVACSNTSSLPEIAGDAALYFDPVDLSSMAAALEASLDPNQRERLSRRGREQAARFTWQQTARLTLAAYIRTLGFS